MTIGPNFHPPLPAIFALCLSLTRHDVIFNDTLSRQISGVLRWRSCVETTAVVLLFLNVRGEWLKRLHFWFWKPFPNICVASYFCALSLRNKRSIKKGRIMNVVAFCFADFVVCFGVKYARKQCCTGVMSCENRRSRKVMMVSGVRVTKCFWSYSCQGFAAY